MCVCVAARSEERRVKLREIEVKVVRYQDELESGVQSRIAGLSVADQVQQYRQQLLRKVTPPLLPFFFDRHFLFLIGPPLVGAQNETTSLREF